MHSKDIQYYEKDWNKTFGRRFILFINLEHDLAIYLEPELSFLNTADKKQISVKRTAQEVVAALSSPFSYPGCQSKIFFSRYSSYYKSPQ